MPTARSRPLIGITTYRQVTSWWAWERDAALVPGPYLDMVEAAGGQPVLLPTPGETSGPEPVTPGSEAELGPLVAKLDGLLLIGGGDIGAHHYGQDPDPRNGGTNGRRDDLELSLVTAALAADLPLLAVCRGMQVLNVALGGGLVQQLSDRIDPNPHQPAPGQFGRVEVSTSAGSTVRRLFGPRLPVLCSHHQAIASLGEGLMVTATSLDGVIEAVELPGHRFVVGVQWHPEEEGGLTLFRALTEAALAVDPTTSHRSRATPTSRGVADE
jgi:putative glutamine amidotransferase